MNSLVVVFGMEFKSEKQAAEFFGVDRGTVYTRKKVQGMTLEEALITPVREKIEVIVEGKTFESLAQACMAYEANYSTVYYRIKYERMDPAEAILLERKRDKPVDIGDRSYKCQNDAYKDYDISPITVFDRRERGMSLIDAITVPVVRSNIKVIKEGAMVV